MDFISGLFSNTIAIIVVHPIDVIKSRYQIEHSKSFNKITKDILYSNGIKGFYRGLFLYNSVSLINFTIMMTIMEFIKNK